MQGPIQSEEDINDNNVSQNQSSQLPKHQILGKPQNTSPLIGCSYFGELVMQSHDLSIAIAARAINNGQPNVYIGNSGIINDLYQTPLIVLISSENPKWIEIALESGADPNLPSIWRDDGQKIYPLTRAFEHGNHLIVNLLLEYGADVKKVDVNELLKHAIWPGESFECVKIAISLGAQVLRRHVQIIVWRWHFQHRPVHPHNANYIKIWQYLYKISPSIGEFMVSDHNYDHGDTKFADWIKNPRLMGYGEEVSTLTLY
jgi:hypothetical protein